MAHLSLPLSLSVQSLKLKRLKYEKKWSTSIYIIETYVLHVKVTTKSVLPDSLIHS